MNWPESSASSSPRDADHRISSGCRKISRTLRGNPEIRRGTAIRYAQDSPRQGAASPTRRQSSPHPKSYGAARETAAPRSIRYPAAAFRHAVEYASDSIASSNALSANPGQPLRQHRLARSRRAYHEHVMIAGGCDLQRPLCTRLSPHIAKIRRARVPVPEARQPKREPAKILPADSSSRPLPPDAARRRPVRPHDAASAAFSIGRIRF